MRKSKENTGVKDVDYVPTTNSSLDSSHSSDDISLNTCMPRKRKTGPIRRSQKNKANKRPRKKSFSEPEVKEVLPRSPVKRRLKERKL